jgi:hypothetical protein
VDAQALLGWVSVMRGRRAEAAERWRPVAGAVADPSTLVRMIEVFDQAGDPAAARVARSRLAQLGASR